MYILRGCFRSYEVWDAASSRREVVARSSLGAPAGLLALVEALVRDEDNRGVIRELVVEHVGRACPDAMLPGLFVDLVDAGRLALRESGIFEPYPLCAPEELEPGVELQELSAPAELPAELSTTGEQGEDDGVDGEPTPRGDGASSAALGHLEVEPPLRFHRVHPGCLRARGGTGLLVPSPETGGAHPLAGVMAALDHLAAHPSKVLVMVGHRSPDDPPGAVELGHQRAAALHALLTAQRAAWVGLATEAGGYADIQHYLRYLEERRGWPCDPGEADGVVGPRSRAAVTSFQARYNERWSAAILEDGVCGSQTLGAIFDVLRMEFERWMLKHGLDASVLRLHSQTPVLDGGLDWVEHSRMFGPPTPPGRRMVDLLLLDPHELGLAGPLTPGDLYDHPRASLETIPVVEEEGEWEYGQLTVVTDLGDAYVEVHERYRLCSDDGSYDLELDAATDGTLDDGAVELRFKQIPVGPRYSMTVTNTAGEAYPLFTGLTYPELYPRSIAEPDSLDMAS